MHYGQLEICTPAPEREIAVEVIHANFCSLDNLISSVKLDFRFEGSCGLFAVVVDFFGGPKASKFWLGMRCNLVLQKLQCPYFEIGTSNSSPNRSPSDGMQHYALISSSLDCKL